jgi:hypothetical protein
MSASELLHASDSESEPEEDDDLAASGSAPDANLIAAGGSLATNIKDEIMVDWNAVNGPVVADQQSATYLSTMLIAVAEQMAAAQRMHSRPPER